MYTLYAAQYVVGVKLFNCLLKILIFTIFNGRQYKQAKNDNDRINYDGECAC